MLLVQKWPFFQLYFFQAIWATKMSFTIFQNQKTPFQTIKTQSSKIRKIDIFSKGLTQSFSPKMAIFPTLFFRQCRPVKWVLRCSKTKKNLSRLKKREVQKVKKLTFFQRVKPCFWSKNGSFSKFFFSGNLAQKKSFTICYNQKTSFQAIKAQSLKI